MGSSADAACDGGFDEVGEGHAGGHLFEGVAADGNFGEFGGFETGQEGVKAGGVADEDDCLAWSDLVGVGLAGQDGGGEVREVGPEQGDVLIGRACGDAEGYRLGMAWEEGAEEAQMGFIALFQEAAVRAGGVPGGGNMFAGKDISARVDEEAAGGVLGFEDGLVGGEVRGFIGILRVARGGAERLGELRVVLAYRLLGEGVEEDIFALNETDAGGEVGDDVLGGSGGGKGEGSGCDAVGGDGGRVVPEAVLESLELAGQLGVGLGLEAGLLGVGTA